jgi:ribosomal protein L11 methyltransferase
VYADGAEEEAVRHALGGVAPVASTAVEPGWELRWREFHRPVRVGGIWIGPPWERAPVGEPTVVVDPGRAFGTGAHPTTRACIELLARSEPRARSERRSLLDAGCGSGVVAVAAARLGFAPVIAVDVDPVAVDIARETADANGVSMSVACLDVLEADLPASEVVVANIELRVVERLLPRVEARAVVTSGYLTGEEPRVSGWEIVDRRELDGWAAHVLVPQAH